MDYVPKFLALIVDQTHMKLKTHNNKHPKHPQTKPNPQVAIPQRKYGENKPHRDQNKTQ